LVFFFALLIFGTSVLPPGRYLLGYIAVLSGLLIGVGFLKGEPLRRRNHGDG
jgi:hypothetical protein